MKILWKIIKWILIIIALFILFLYFTGNNYIIRGAALTYLKGEKTANIDDYKHFDNNVILADNPREWMKHHQYNQIKLNPEFEKELQDYQSAAFLIIKDGQLINEHYFNGYNEKSLTNSFSMAKSILTLLIGKAIDDGYIKSFDQKITDFLPEYKDDSFASKCTLADLSAMTSGYDWSEEYYSPLNPTAKAYYGDDIEKQILDRKFIAEPGGHFNYLSGDTQLLGIILKRALKGKSISQYAQETLWLPMGMEFDAQWSKDRPDGMEKVYCCFNSDARDFAKLGQLLLNDGNWYGKQIIDSSFIKKITAPNLKAFKKEEIPIYGHSIWMDPSYKTPFYGMLGHLGQRIIIIPSLNLVVVRTGKTHNDLPEKNPIKDGDVYRLVDEAVRINQNIK